MEQAKLGNSIRSHFRFVSTSAVDMIHVQRDIIGLRLGRRRIGIGQAEQSKI